MEEEEEIEIWKNLPIKEFTHYVISSFGEVSLDLVTSVTKNTIRKPLVGNINKKGYIIVGLSRFPKVNGKLNTKTFALHKLVAIVFNNHIPSGMKVLIGHKDDNKLNNKATNLYETNNRDNIRKSRINSTGFTGIRKSGNNFAAQIYYKGVHIHLGSFKTKEKASLYYKEAIRQIKKGNTPIQKKSNYHTTAGISGFQKVYKSRKKWTTRIRLDNRNMSLGTFDTPEQANEAYQKAVKKIEKYNIRTFKEFKNMK